MKKIKRLAALLLAAVLCLSLAGCRELDEARANQAFWNPDGSIQWGDFSYKALPACDEFNPQTADRPTIWVTEPDVPVLLRDAFGKWMDRSEDEVFLWLESGTIYCREDKYDAIAQRIENGFVRDGYAYFYGEYSEETGEWQERVYKLSPSQEKVVDDIVATVEPEDIPDNATMEYEYGITLHEVSDDLLFRRESYGLEAIGDTYYVVDYLTESTTVYKVPAVYQDTFAAIMAPYLKAEYGVDIKTKVEYFGSSL